MKELIVLLSLMTLIQVKISATQEYFIYDTKAMKEISIKEMAKQNESKDAVFFGEFHDDSLVHVLQYEFLKELYIGKKDIAVSMEMFERDCQKFVDDYMSGKITEDDFVKNARPWPDYKKFYKQLLELAKENKQYLIASNIPRKYAALYASQGMSGIDTLNTTDRNYVAKEMILKEDAYLDKFFGTMLGKDDTLSKQTPNQLNTLYMYYGAQVIKDETMAESIAQFMAKNSDKMVVHFDGDFHSNSYLGTVQKFNERTGSNYKISVITPVYYEKKSEIVYNDTLKNLADFIIFLTEPVREPEPPMANTGGKTHLGENFVESHKINLSISPSKSFLKGTDEIVFKNPIIKSSSLYLLKTLEVEKVDFQGQKLDYKVIPHDELYNEIVFENPTVNNQKYGKNGIIEVRSMKITYSGKVFNKPSETNLIQRHSNSAGIISGEKGEGIYLPGSSFYPRADYDMANFEVTIKIPKDFSIVTSCIVKSEVISEKLDNANEIKQYSIKTEFPIDDMILVGGRYIESSKMFEDKKFSMFTFDSTNLTDKYLDASIDYYKLYTKLFGKYPFKDFSIVENFFATGFGMPGYTLLSGKLMAMPWVTLSPGSLAHEFVHNWWGNSAFVDYEAGNWCEALTSFSTNYYYNVLTNNSKGTIDWRKQALLSIDNLPLEKNYPVSEFKSQKDNYDAVIGYQKGAFIFYEVLKLMGEESFFNSLKTFAEKYKGKRAYWSNLTSTFDAQAKKDSIKHPIKKVMNNWLKNKVLPVINLESVEFSDDSVKVTVKQNGKNYLSIPVVFTGTELNKKVNMIIQDSITTVVFKTDKPAKKVSLDPDYESMRKLYSWEKPFNFNRVLNDNPIVVMPEEDSPDYKIAEQFLVELKESEYKFKAIQSKNIENEDIKNNSLIILGNYENNKMVKAYQIQLTNYLGISEKGVDAGPQKLEQKDALGMLNIDHLVNPEKLVTVIYYKDLVNADPLKRLFHYLTYSGLLLNANKSGRPIKQAEIFPSVTDKVEMEKIKK